MTDDKKPVPIIKKVKKVSGGGHHGGAWKIAYADFVTAMMAFFLLLWLLTTTPSQTLQGIADYFAPTIGLKDKMGIGFYGGKTPLEEGNSRNETPTSASIKYGVPNSGETVREPTPSKSESGEEASENARFEQIKEQLQQAIEQSQDLSQFKNNINITITAEGLKISLVDQEKVSMFKIGSSELEPHAKMILKKIGEFVKSTPNKLSISGHTDSVPYGSNATYTNWELSADRANSSRRFLESEGINKDKTARVIGMADKEHTVPNDPKSPMNRRISLTLLHKSIAPYSEKAAPEAFFEGRKIDPQKLLEVKPEQKPEIKITPTSKYNLKSDQVKDPFNGGTDSSAPNLEERKEIKQGESPNQPTKAVPNSIKSVIEGVKQP